MLLAEAARDQFSLTAELPRTLKALFLRPGLLSQEYGAGRIARYVHPLRLYLAASLVFFLTLSITSGTNRGSVVRLSPAAPDSTASRQGVSVSATPDTSDGDSVEINTPWTALNERLEARIREMKALPDGVAEERIGSFMIRRAPIMVFMLVPLFALMIKVLYWRTRRYYAEHFVFALHVHAFSFLLFTAIFLLKNVQESVALALFCWVAIYPLFALRRAYGQGWIKTIIKYAVLGVGYNMLLATALVIEVIIAVMLV